MQACQVARGCQWWTRTFAHGGLPLVVFPVGEYSACQFNSSYNTGDPSPHTYHGTWTAWPSIARQPDLYAHDSAPTSWLHLAGRSRRTVTSYSGGHLAGGHTKKLPSYCRWQCQVKRCSAHLRICVPRRRSRLRHLYGYPRRNSK